MHASGSPRGRQSPPAATDSSIADGDFLRSDSDESVRRGRHKVDRWRHGFDCIDILTLRSSGISVHWSSGNPEDQWTEMPEERSVRMSRPVRQYGVTD